MKNKISFGLAMFAFMLLAGGLCIPSRLAYAEDDASGSTEQNEEVTGASISLMPVSKILQISPLSSYEDKMTITNDGSKDMEIEVYAAPYSYVHSDEDDSYRLGFNNDNNFTQISRWITFDNGKGEWVKRAVFSIPGNESLEVTYRITTPDSIPAGGQYAVIFAHTLTGVVSSSGIRTEASPGMVLYGRSTEGEVKVEAGISNMNIGLGTETNGTKRDNFYASAKVKNNGNVDFNAVGKLKVEGIIGGGSYETPPERGRVSIIPEAELEVRDEWEDSPSFGLFKVTWTVTAGESTETIETIILVNPVPVIIISIIVLTIIIVWVTIVIRKRKERRSRLAV